MQVQSLCRVMRRPDYFYRFVHQKCSYHLSSTCYNARHNNHEVRLLFICHKVNFYSEKWILYSSKFLNKVINYNMYVKFINLTFTSLTCHCIITLPSLTCRQSNVWHWHGTPVSHNCPFPEISRLGRNISWMLPQFVHHPDKTSEKYV